MGHWLEYAYCLVAILLGRVLSLSWVWRSSFGGGGRVELFFVAAVWNVHIEWLIYRKCVRAQFTFISINHFVIKSSFHSTTRQLNFIWNHWYDRIFMLCLAQKFNVSFTCFRLIFRFRIFDSNERMFIMFVSDHWAAKRYHSAHNHVA